jgi:NAD(P)-dependent dehydrogenase (short-subunit alcohol dehydrogenase family)
MAERLKGRVAIITGASRGLGQYCALGYAREGAKVVVAARSVDEPDPRLPGTIYHTASLIEQAGGEALPLVCNVADAQSISEMVDQVLTHWGRIDILMNNAAIQPPGGNADIQPRHWELQYRVNVHGPFHCIRAVLPAMKSQGGGSIINISSAASGGGTPYGGSKRAVEAMTEGFAAELQSDGIAVNSLKPVSIIQTPGYLAGTPEIPPSDSYVEAAILLVLQSAEAFTGRVHNDAEIIGLLADDESKQRFRGLNPDYWIDIMDGASSRTPEGAR